MDLIKEEEFSCQVCYYAFGSGEKCPRILSCGHSFCHSCLKRILNNCERSPVCPTCSGKIQFRVTDEIPINFIVKSVSERLNQNKTLVESNCETESNAASSSSKGEKNLKRKHELSYEGYCKAHCSPNHLKCLTCSKYICGSCFFFAHKECPNVLPVLEAMNQLKRKKTQRLDLLEQKVKGETESLKNELVNLIEEYKQLQEDIKQKKRSKDEKEIIHKDLEKIRVELQEASCNQVYDKADSKCKAYLEKINYALPTVLINLSMEEVRDMLHKDFLKTPSYVVMYIDNEKKYSKVNIKKNSITFGLWQNEIKEHEECITICIVDFLQAKVSVCSCNAQTSFNTYRQELYNPDFPANTMYGKLEVAEDKNIKIHCFTNKSPPQYKKPFIVDFSNLLTTLQLGNLIPCKAFVKVATKGEFMIEVDSLSPRGVNFLLLASGLTGHSFKGRSFVCGTDMVQVGSMNDTWAGSAVEGITDGGIYEADCRRGFVIGEESHYEEDLALFKIIKLGNDYETMDFKFAEVTSGMDVVEELDNQDSISACGFLISHLNEEDDD